MDKNELLSHEEQRKKLWAMAWCSVASASDCKSIDVATRWADGALQKFDSRFPKPISMETKD